MFKYLIFVFILTLQSVAEAQLMHPDDFLGYPLGSKFTPHYQLINYIKHVETSLPQKVKMIQYGSTYEGRPLYIVIVTDSVNQTNLEFIRKNNLRLAMLSKDKMAPQEDAPAIVWLSYNVHGNEPSSSEASMLTLYELAKSVNPNVNKWLNNTVVVIDPCLNPDGRDRYVHWFQSVSGIKPDVEKISREHHEPSPGGRTNHYYFDLNRDWAWQTQKETEARMKIYNQWMPQIHVDYHEQGIEDPYYFAPAAEPFHEVITPWQRAFQDSIGRNHARYFDANSWLYFTKQRFDLLYPSYGDTYPTFNGAIGMTYEQAGIGAGLGVVTYTGDTLTLKDRISHHLITALSTIEVASNQRKSLISEFRTYFTKGLNGGFGVYKTYVIKKGSMDNQKMASFISLLDKNEIRYGAASGSISGYHYSTGKDTTMIIQKGDLVISALQPRAALLKVLMEPKSTISDSVTYDITAWSLPLVYGLDALASRQTVNLQAYYADSVPVNTGKDMYGYVVKWEGLKSARAVSELLKKGIRLRYNELPFKLNGETFNRGSVIILKNGNQHFEEKLPLLIKQVCDRENIYAYGIETGLMDKGQDFGSDYVHVIKPKKILLVAGNAVSYNALGSVWHFFEQQLNYDITLIHEEQFVSYDLSNTDIVILPAGDYLFMSQKSVVENLNGWISKGGRLIAIDAAVSAISKFEWGLKPRKAEEEDEKKDGYAPLKIYEKRERDFMKNITPGSIYKVDLDTTHPLAFGYSSGYFTLKQNDLIYDFIAGGGWNVGVIKQAAQKAGFVGSKLKDKLKDFLVFGVQNIGKGSVVYFTDDILFRSFWENGKLMLCNALFFEF